MGYGKGTLAWNELKQFPANIYLSKVTLETLEKILKYV